MSLLLAVQKDHSAPVHGILDLEESKILKPDSFYNLVGVFASLNLSSSLPLQNNSYSPTLTLPKFSFVHGLNCKNLTQMWAEFLAEFSKFLLM